MKTFCHIVLKSAFYIIVIIHYYNRVSPKKSLSAIGEKNCCYLSVLFHLNIFLFSIFFKIIYFILSIYKYSFNLYIILCGCRIKVPTLYIYNIRLISLYLIIILNPAFSDICITTIIIIVLLSSS